MIKERLKVIQSHKKSFTDPKRCEIEFEAGGYVFLKVTLSRGVIRFGVKGKLAPRYIGPFKILERIRNMVYHLNLPSQLGYVHNVFHVFML